MPSLSFTTAITTPGESPSFLNRQKNVTGDTLILSETVIPKTLAPTGCVLNTRTDDLNGEIRFEAESEGIDFLASISVGDIVAIRWSGGICPACEVTGISGSTFDVQLVEGYGVLPALETALVASTYTTIVGNAVFLLADPGQCDAIAGECNYPFSVAFFNGTILPGNLKGAYWCQEATGGFVRYDSSETWKYGAVLNAPAIAEGESISQTAVCHFDTSADRTITFSLLCS